MYNLRDDLTTPTPTPSEIDLFLNPLNLPALLELQLAELNAPITEQEICSVIQSMPRGKALGPDRFSNEYYQAFSPNLTPHLCKLFNQTIISGAVPAKRLQDTVITIPKPGKTPDTPANLRPISLLNSNIKLYAKIIASRMLKVLPTLIIPTKSASSKVDRRSGLVSAFYKGLDKCIAYMSKS